MQVFSPIAINGMRLKNRFVRSATGEGMANPDGSASDRLEALLFGRRHLAAQEVVDALLAAIHTHTDQAPLFDDVTVVVLRRMAP